MRSISLATAALAILLALAACGGNKTIKPADQAAIDAVSVAAIVKVPNEPLVIGSEAGLTILFGGAGFGALAADAEKKDVKTFLEFLTAAGIDIGEIVRQQFSEQLKSHAFYGSRLSADGGYRFVLEVPSYGMNKVNALSSYWQAAVRIDYKLVSPDGRVLAEDWAMTSPFGDRPKFTMEELQANPQVLKQALENAASVVSAKLMKK